MDTKALNILNEINFNLRSISSYIEKISKQELKLDLNKIYLIDYSNCDWLNGSDKEKIRQSLEEYNQQLCHHMISDDFVQYCRTIYLQIEILLNLYDQSENSKFKKLKCIFIKLRGGEENFKSYNDKEYKTITHIMNIRDIASHTDPNGKSIAERVELKGKRIKIWIGEIDRKIDENNIIKLKKNIHSKFCSDRSKPEGSVIITDETEKGYLYITVYDLKDINSTDNDLLKYIEQILNIYQYLLGEKPRLEEKKQTNELKKFFEEKNYQDVLETLDWFVREIGDYVNKQVQDK